MPLGADDILAKARDRADVALETNWRSCFKATAITFVGGTGTIGLLALGLLQSQLIAPVVFWWILGITSFASGPGTLLFFHLSDLYAKADALRNLVGAQKNYEVLLAQVRDERNDLESKAIELKHENAGIRSAMQCLLDAVQRNGQSD